MSKKKNKKKVSLFSLLIIICLMLTGYVQSNLTSTNGTTPPPLSNSSNMQVHYIDVGQADSILINSNGHFMLIDAGNNDDDKLVVSYLQSQGVEKLDYIIATHPHEDHIGGMDTVVDTFDIGNVIMPNIETTTKTYESFIDSLINKNVTAIEPKPGNTYELGESIFTIISPNNEYEKDLNNWSVGIKLEHGENSFIFTGDAEKASETDILNNNIDISADVLKLGHHGSSTSNTEEFLKAIKPKYAVICVGENNKYGHPHKETIEKLNKLNIEVYRTDKNGNVVATSDGKNISWTTER